MFQPGSITLSIGGYQQKVTLLPSNPKYDIYCQQCGCLMKLRKGKYGEFYGCTGYPQCRNTMSKRDAALSYIAPDFDKDSSYHNMDDYIGHPGDPRYYGDS